MSESAVDSIEWDGKQLTGWIRIDGSLHRVVADRDTIHRHASGFNDALTWEIERHRAEILEKLRPFFMVTHANAKATLHGRDNDIV